MINNEAEGRRDEKFVEQNKKIQDVGSICPCSSFSSSAQVISALKSSARTKVLIEWMQGSQLKNTSRDAFEKVPLSSYRTCNNRMGCAGQLDEGRCPNRVGAAYCVLNAIRDGCRHFLEDETVTSATEDSDFNMKASNQKLATYEETFPTLSTQQLTMASQSMSTVNVLKPKKKVKKKATPVQIAHNPTRAQNATQVKLGQMSYFNNNKGNKTMKVKRRIRPAPVTQTSPWSNVSSLQNVSKNSSTWPKAATATEKKISSTGSQDMLDRIMSSTITPPKRNISSSQNNCGNASTWSKSEISLVKNDPSTVSESDGMRRITARNIIPPENKNVHDLYGGNGKVPELVCAPISLSEHVQNDHGPDRILCPDEVKHLRKHTTSLYSIIIKNRLAPSIALELQLLIRLLNLNDVENVTRARPHEDTTPDLKTLFLDVRSCRMFAKDVLEDLRSIVVNLDSDVLMPFISLGAVIEQMPDLTNDIQHCLDARRNAMLSQGKNVTTDATNVISGKSPILTIPFQEKRDSRHNYRSRDLSSLYNNRENSRDAFLFQLRAFQQMRGTVLNPAQVKKSQDAIKEASRQMMLELLPTNVPWFTELFLDMLQQIGLVPMQETDADILNNVSDKEKLQKLHSRFTSKVAQKNKSSKPLVLRGQNDISGPSPEESFCGHQEFFYLFIQSVNAHSFCMHLQKRLVYFIITASSSNETKGLEQRICQLQLLAKFLGLVVFSPNWMMNYHVPEDPLSLAHYYVPVIPINILIEEAYKQHRLILIIPWCCSYLRMIAWDRISIKLPYFRETFSMLRSIHKDIPSTPDGSTSIDRNMLILSFQLDALFADVMGLNQTEISFEYLLPNKSSRQDEKSLDIVPIDFSKAYISVTCPHLDDLHKLVVDLSTSTTRKRIGGASKKLKPFILSTNPSNSMIDEASSDKDNMSPLDPLIFGKLQLLMSKSKFINQGQNLCIDAFFHQNKALHLLCDFVVDFSIENMLSKQIVEECIGPCVLDSFLEKVPHHSIPSSVSIDWYLQTLQSIEKDVALVANSYTRRFLDQYILSVMFKMVPPYMHANVRWVATALTLKHAIQKGLALSSSLVRAEAKRIIDIQLRPHSKPLKQRKPKYLKISSLVSISISEMKGLADDSRSKDDSLQCQGLKEVIGYLDDYSKVQKYPYSFFDSTSIHAIRSLLTFLISRATKLSVQVGEKYGIALGQEICDIARLAASIGLAGFSVVELPSLGRILCQPKILKKFLQRKRVDDMKVIQRCLDGGVFTKADLEKGLLDLLEGLSLSQTVSKCVINTICEIRANHCVMDLSDCHRSIQS